MSTNYIAEFYKTNEHDYKDYFKGYVEDSKIYDIDKEIKAITEQLELKREERSRLYSQRYNAQFTPIEGRIILYYSSNRTDTELYFEAITGVPIDRSSICPEDRTYNVSTKAGDFEVVAGYCFPLGSIITRKYNYKIATNNSRCACNLVNEWIVPVIDCEQPPINKNGEVGSKYLTHLDATEFIQKMYNIPNFNLKLNIAAFCKYLKQNASTEVILKTAPNAQIASLLLDKEVDKAEPLYKIVGVTKAEYDTLVEKGVLEDYIRIQNEIEQGLKQDCNRGLTKEDFFHYTVADWMEIINKAHYWETELEFNKVTFNDSLIISLLNTFIRNSCGSERNLFYRYYSFGKFLDYVSEEACNQGFASVTNFTSELRDYLNMCETMRVTPSLYTSYLKQTHDILARNYKIVITEDQEKLFAGRYEDFKPFTTKDKEYAIVAPRESDDIKQEGYKLNHCVASYINRVITGTSKILFLRKAKKTSESLVTLEVINKAIVQARGASNRSINKEEYAALKEYAIANKLVLTVQPRE